jgi:hypothetical protein
LQAPESRLTIALESGQVSLIEGCRVTREIRDIEIEIVA